MNLHQRGMIEVRGISKTKDGLTVRVRQLSNTPRPPSELCGLRAKLVIPHEDMDDLFIHACAAGNSLDEESEWEGEPVTDLRFRACLAKEEWTVSFWDPSAPDKTCFTYDASWLVYGCGIEGEDIGWIWESFLARTATGVEVLIQPRQIVLDLD